MGKPPVKVISKEFFFRCSLYFNVSTTFTNCNNQFIDDLVLVDVFIKTSYETTSF